MPRKKLFELLDRVLGSASSTTGGVVGPSGDLVRYTNRLSYDDLVNAESEFGRTLFGPIPEGHQREFFEHRKNIWIWHESWLDETGAEQSTTIRYEVRPEGVFKKAAEQDYVRLTGDELENFRAAAKSYLALVKEKLYS